MRGQGKIGTLAIWIIVMYLVVQYWVFFYNLESASTTGKEEYINGFSLPWRVEIVNINLVSEGEIFRWQFTEKSFAFVISI